jgi:hypothetical protein
MSPSRAPIGRVEWTRWVAAMACRCGRSTHGDNDAPRSDVQGSTPPPRRLRGACESSQVFRLAACARPAAAASRRPDPDIRLGSGMVIRRESAPPSGRARRGLRPRVRLTCLGLADPPYCSTGGAQWGAPPRAADGADSHPSPGVKRGAPRRVYMPRALPGGSIRRPPY